MSFGKAQELRNRRAVLRRIRTSLRNLDLSPHAGLTTRENDLSNRMDTEIANAVWGLFDQNLQPAQIVAHLKENQRFFR